MRLTGVFISNFGGEELDHSRRGILAGVLKNGGERGAKLGDQVGHAGLVVDPSSKYTF
jgi:hypothetical protein